MAKPTRGVFGLILSNFNPQIKPGSQLLSERADGKGWNLIGGRQEEGENDTMTLKREASEEASITIDVMHFIGEGLTFGDDTAIAYACRIIGGQLTTSPEAICHRYCTAEEVRQGFYDGPDGTKKNLHIVGPIGRLGRTGRMIWDGFSLMQPPVETPNDNTIFPGIYVSEDKLWLVDGSNTTLRQYRRLDPYTASGFME